MKHLPTFSFNFRNGTMMSQKAVSTPKYDIYLTETLNVEEGIIRTEFSDDNYHADGGMILRTCYDMSDLHPVLTTNYCVDYIDNEVATAMGGKTYTITDAGKNLVSQAYDWYRKSDHSEEFWSFMLAHCERIMSQCVELSVTPGIRSALSLTDNTVWDPSKTGGSIWGDDAFLLLYRESLTTLNLTEAILMAGDTFPEINTQAKVVSEVMKFLFVTSSGLKSTPDLLFSEEAVNVFPSCLAVIAGLTSPATPSGIDVTAQIVNPAERWLREILAASCNLGSVSFSNGGPQAQKQLLSCMDTALRYHMADSGIRTAVESILVPVLNYNPTQAQGVDRLTIKPWDVLMMHLPGSLAYRYRSEPTEVPFLFNTFRTVDQSQYLTLWNDLLTETDPERQEELFFDLRDSYNELVGEWAEKHQNAFNRLNRNFAVNTFTQPRTGRSVVIGIDSVNYPDVYAPKPAPVKSYWHFLSRCLSPCVNPDLIPAPDELSPLSILPVDPGTFSPKFTLRPAQDNFALTISDDGNSKLVKIPYSIHTKYLASMPGATVSALAAANFDEIREEHWELAAAPEMREDQFIMAISVAESFLMDNTLYMTCDAPATMGPRLCTLTAAGNMDYVPFRLGIVIKQKYSFIKL